MNDRQRRQRRLEATSRLFKLLRSPDFRHTYNVPGASGQHQYLVALPDDPMSVVFEYAATHRGRSYIVVPEGTGVSVVGVDVVDTRDEAPEDEDNCPVHPDTTIAMLLTLLRVRGGPLTCHEARPDVTMRLLDDGREQPVPL